MIPLAKYIDNIHNVVVPLYQKGEKTMTMVAEN